MITSPAEIAIAFSAGLVVVVLGMSALAKLGRATQTLAAMADLRVPVSLQRRWAANALPAAEFALAAGMLLAPGMLRVAAGAAAAAMLGVFSILLVGVLLRRDEASCECFGALSVERRVTWWAVARNVGLIAAAVVSTLGGAAAAPFIVDLTRLKPIDLVLLVALWLAVLVGVLARIIAVLRHRATERLDLPPAPVAVLGDKIPDLEVVTNAGVTTTLPRLGTGSPVLLIFLSSECGKCIALAPRLPEWRAAIAPVQLRVVTSSHPRTLESVMPQVLDGVLFGSKAVRRAFGVSGSPAAVLLGGELAPVVASPVAHRVREIEGLIGSIVAARASTG